MTILVESIQSDTIAGLEAAVNAFLAPLIAAGSVTIIGFDIVLADLDRYKGMQFSAIITYNTVGAASQATPYVLKMFDEGNSINFETVANAWYATFAANFLTGVRNVTFTNNPSRLQRLTAWAIRSTTAVAGGTNWALI